MNGFINFFKAPGRTSNQTLGRIKRVLGQKKAGFLGTLDPAASGVLPIGLGKATKLFPFIDNTIKSYESEVIFGSETDTQDHTGQVTASTGEYPDEKALKEAIARFIGEVAQTPPMYSAKKVDGKRLYEIARKGGEVERPQKVITIHALELLSFTGKTARIRATVSTGTYIRTLCHDLGRKLGCLAHMGDLTRTASHIFTLQDSVGLEELEERKTDPDRWLLPLDFPLKPLYGEVHLSRTDETTMKNGGAVNYPTEEDKLVRLYGPTLGFMGLGRTEPVLKKLKAEKLFLP